MMLADTRSTSKSELVFDAENILRLIFQKKNLVKRVKKSSFFPMLISLLKGVELLHKPIGLYFVCFTCIKEMYDKYSVKYDKALDGQLCGDFIIIEIPSLLM